MGLCNLRRIDSVMRSRKQIVEHYIQRFNEIDGIIIFEGNEEATKNYAYFPVLITEMYKSTRYEIYEKLKEKGVYARI